MHIAEPTVMVKKKSNKAAAPAKTRDAFSEELGLRLRELRLLRGVFASHLAERMGVNVSRVLSIETAGRDLQVGTVNAYCMCLGFKIVDAFENFPACSDNDIALFVRQIGTGHKGLQGFDFDNEDFRYMASRIIGLCRRYPELSTQGVKLIGEAAQALAEDENTPASRWFKFPKKQN